MEELSRSLAAERRVLEMLLFKLVAARNLLADRDDRFYAWASAELERVVRLVQDSELERAIAISDLAVARGTTAPLTLADIAATAPAPYGTILDDHRAMLRDLLTEIEAARETSCEMARTATTDSQALTASTCGLSLASLSEFLT